MTAKSATPIYLTMATGVLVHQGRILTQKRLPDDIWGNLWEFPGGLVEEGETPEQAVIREFMEETALSVNHPVPIGTFRHSYTRYRVTLHAFAVSLALGPGRPRAARGPGPPLGYLVPSQVPGLSVRTPPARPPSGRRRKFS